MSIQIGDKVKVLSANEEDLNGIGTERIGQVGEVCNDYSAHDNERFPYGVQFSAPDKTGEFFCAFSADELEVIK